MEHYQFSRQKFGRAYDGFRPQDTRRVAEYRRHPTLVLSSGASITVTKSPCMVRAGFVLTKQSWIMAERAAENSSKRVVTLVNDWGARHRSRDRLQDPLHQGRRQNRRVDPHSARQSRLRALPPACPRPDTAFIYFPGPQAGIFAKQFAERGLANSSIKIIGPGDLTDDDGLNAIGDQMLGMITAGLYSAAHDFAINKTYVSAFEKANNFRPDSDK
jgi:branched-chain amino acid transport system substrate-binding protein